MHVCLVLVASAAVIMSELIGVGISQVSLLQLSIAAAFGMMLVGVPHGALDHLVGLRLLNQMQRTVPRSIRKERLSKLLVFSLSYGLVVIVVIVGWFIAPATTLLIFFALSAWHFGLEEEEVHVSSLLSHVASIARGGMLIWVPCVFQPDQITNVLASVFPYSHSANSRLIVYSIQIASPILVLLTLVDLVIHKTHFIHCIRVSIFGILFAIVHPVVSFVVYFCGWHSIRGLIKLYGDLARPTMLKFIASLAPVSCVTMLLFVAGLWYWNTQGELTPAVMKTLFIGISAIAVPHLILHALDDLLDQRNASQLTHHRTFSRVMANGINGTEVRT
ncbi:MAG: Brp/Blh family beta-carotene 15,15'-dioxygenase [Pirellulales bacterium]